MKALALIIGACVGVLIFAMILTFKRGGHVERTKVAEGKGKPSNKFPAIIPALGYDSNDYHLPTTLEAIAESDSFEIQKAANPSNNQKKSETTRKDRAKKKSRHSHR